jgi:hypothetical protein
MDERAVREEAETVEGKKRRTRGGSGSEVQQLKQIIRPMGNILHVPGQRYSHRFIAPWSLCRCSRPESLVVSAVRVLIPLALKQKINDNVSNHIVYSHLSALISLIVSLVLCCACLFLFSYSLVLQEVYHSTIYIIGLFRRSTYCPTHRFIAPLPILPSHTHTNRPLHTGMPLPMPQPLHGRIRPSLQIIRQPNHEGTSGDGCRGTCSGRVGCYAFVRDSIRNEENGFGGSDTVAYAYQSLMEYNINETTSDSKRCRTSLAYQWESVLEPVSPCFRLLTRSKEWLQRTLLYFCEGHS